MYDGVLKEKALKAHGPGRMFFASYIGALLLSSDPEIISGCHSGGQQVTFCFDSPNGLRTVRQISVSDLVQGTGPSSESGSFRIPITGIRLILDFKPSHFDSENQVQAFHEYWFPLFPDGIHRYNHS
jgi:hypothetical protein